MFQLAKKFILTFHFKVIFQTVYAENFLYEKFFSDYRHQTFFDNVYHIICEPYYMTHIYQLFHRIHIIRPIYDMQYMRSGLIRASKNFCIADGILLSFRIFNMETNMKVYTNNVFQMLILQKSHMIGINGIIYRYSQSHFLVCFLSLFLTVN